MMKQIFLLIIFFCNLVCWGQGYDYVWILGYKNGLDFNTAPPTPVSSGMISQEAAASVCDRDGNLLFYTDGTYIWNRNHDTMPNGRFIQPMGINATQSTSQGALIVPKPGSPNLYYVFSIICSEYQSIAGRFFYSVVDMSLNNGLGDVVAGQKSIWLDDDLTEAMTSVSGNNCNIWILVAGQSGALKAYNLTQEGLDTNYIESSVEGTIPNRIWLGKEVTGCLAVSLDRSLLAMTRNRKACLYRFDANTGTVSDEIILEGRDTGIDAATQQHGICFSPANSKLYLSAYHRALWQYDLSQYDAQAIQNSKVEVAAIRKGCMKIGPDKKVYVIDIGGQALDVIEYPDRPGVNCGYTAGAVSLLSGSDRAIFGITNVITRPVINQDSLMKTDTVNVCFSSTTTLRPEISNADYYQWNTGSTEPFLSVTASGIYWVQYERFCELYIDTYYVNIFNPELHTVNSCKNALTGTARIAFNEPSPVPYLVIWLNMAGDTLAIADSITGLPPGNYSVHIYSASGCDGVIPFQIATLDYRVSFSVSDSLICQGDTVRFHNTSDTYFTSFYWDFGNGHSGTDIVSEHIFRDSGHYTIMLAGLGAVCRDTAYANIVADAPVESFGFTKDKEQLCVGESIQFTPYTGNPVLTVQLTWETGNGNRFASSADPVQHAYDSDGIMEITLTGKFRACPDISVVQTVYVYPQPLVDLGGDTAVCFSGLPLKLNNRAAIEQRYHYQWSTGAVTPEIEVRHPGIYTLKVSTEYGCSNAGTVEVKKNCYIDIPNAFSPDGDGINDYFFPRQLLSKSISRFRMDIYNRWGQLLYTTANPDGRGWDGRFNGQEQPGGVYIYRIETGWDNGKQERYEGNVTLLR